MIQIRIDNAPMSGYQIRVVALCILLFTIEGYDILAMAFAAPGVGAAWQLGPGTIGLLISAGFAGMALGSSLIAPLADRYGRRTLSLWCLLVVAIGMLIAAVAAGPIILGVGRVVTGIGAGGLIATLPVLIAEFTPARRRATMIGLYTCGLPLGGVIGGLVAGQLTAFGWRSVFIVGGVLTLAILVLCIIAMPESLSFLTTRKPPRALERINTLLTRMRVEPVTAIPELTPENRAPVSTALFREGNAMKTFVLWIVFFVMMSGFYFATGWTPAILERSGFTAEQGISGGMILNVGGVLAAVTFSIAATKIPRRYLTSGGFISMALVFALTSYLIDSTLALVLTAAFLVGFTINAAATGLMAVVPDLYTARSRVTAMGWAATCGRIGAIVSPTFVGWLLERGWTPAAVFLLFAGPILLAGIALYFLLSRYLPRAMPGSRSESAKRGHDHDQAPAATTMGATSPPSGGNTHAAPPR